VPSFDPVRAAGHRPAAIVADQEKSPELTHYCRRCMMLMRPCQRVDLGRAMPRQGRPPHLFGKVTSRAIQLGFEGGPFLTQKPM